MASYRRLNPQEYYERRLLVAVYTLHGLFRPQRLIADAAYQRVSILRNLDAHNEITHMLEIRIIAMAARVQTTLLTQYQFVRQAPPSKRAWAPAHEKPS